MSRPPATLLTYLHSDMRSDSPYCSPFLSFLVVTLGFFDQLGSPPFCFYLPHLLCTSGRFLRLSSFFWKLTLAWPACLRYLPFMSPTPPFSSIRRGHVIGSRCVTHVSSWGPYIFLPFSVGDFSHSSGFDPSPLLTVRGYLLTPSPSSSLFIAYFRCPSAQGSTPLRLEPWRPDIKAFPFVSFFKFGLARPSASFVLPLPSQFLSISSGLTGAVPEIEIIALN